MNKCGGKSICLISGGMYGHNLRLQPWRYLYEVARQLAGHNYRVTVLTDGGLGETSEDDCGVQLIRLPSVRSPLWKRNIRLQQTLELIQPDCLLWHIGLTNVIYETVRHKPAQPVVGIFTTPIYAPRELFHLGWRKLGRNLSLCGVHLAGSLISRRFIRARLEQSRLAKCVVQTQTTRTALLQQQLLPGQIEVIPPGVDDVWTSCRSFNAAEARQALGYTRNDFVVLYLGAPAELRGLLDLIRAADLARREQPNLKLLILSRQATTELQLQDRLRQAEMQEYAQIISGYLIADRLANLVRACDAVALPFELVPSDAPLSVLEVKATGKPLITTSVACLPELATGGNHILANPSDPLALATALLQTMTRCSEQRTNPAKPPPARGWESVGEEWVHLLQTL
jgi:glycosyltransferase involved in cell wall biosynthesis